MGFRTPGRDDPSLVVLPVGVNNRNLQANSPTRWHTRAARIGEAVIDSFDGRALENPYRVFEPKPVQLKVAAVLFFIPTIPHKTYLHKVNIQSPYECSVFPSSKLSACGTSSSTACSDSTAPLGLPGTFKISVLPRTPHTPRLRAANGVFFKPSLRMRSPTPSIRRSQIASVASGVTSRTAIPVPPVVTMNCASSARWTSAF